MEAAAALPAPITGKAALASPERAAATALTAAERSAFTTLPTMVRPAVTILPTMERPAVAALAAMERPAVTILPATERPAVTILPATERTLIAVSGATICMGSPVTAAMETAAPIPLAVPGLPGGGWLLPGAALISGSSGSVSRSTLRSPGGGAASPARLRLHQYRIRGASRPDGDAPDPGRG